jgi:pyruvate formate lyase activating enzyme
LTADEVIRTILEDRLFYEESGGGATFSGGEPLMQPDFLRALLEGCRRNDIHAALDTCGFGCTDVLLEQAALADLVLFDVKLMDDRLHREFTGVSNQPILENLRALAAVHPAIWLRVPLIPGVTDRHGNLAAIAGLASRTPSVLRVCLLPYHRTGVQKFRRLGLPYRLEGVEAPGPESVDAALSVFRAAGVAAVAGG